MSQPAEPSSPTASSKTSSQSRRTHRHSHTRSAASLSNLPSSGVGPSSKPTRNAHSASSSLTKIIVDALRPDPVNDPSSSTASASGTALMKSKSQELHGRGKSVASTTATTSAAARLMPKERRPRTFSTSTCASTFSDTKSSRIRLRVKARMIARQLAISSDEAKQSLVQIRIDSADRSRQSAERALRESLVQKATLESTLDALRRELQDSRSQLEDCRREKESLQIENSMLVEELAELRRHPSMLGVGKSVRARASSSTIRQRAHTLSEPPKPLPPTRRQRSRDNFLAVSPAFSPLTPIPQSPLIFADEQDSFPSPQPPLNSIDPEDNNPLSSPPNAHAHARANNANDLSPLTPFSDSVLSTEGATMTTATDTETDPLSEQEGDDDTVDMPRRGGRQPVIPLFADHISFLTELEGSAISDASDPAARGKGTIMLSGDPHRPSGFGFSSLRANMDAGDNASMSARLRRMSASMSTTGESSRRSSWATSVSSLDDAPVLVIGPGASGNGAGSGIGGLAAIGMGHRAFPPLPPVPRETMESGGMVGGRTRRVTIATSGTSPRGPAMFSAAGAGLPASPPQGQTKGRDRAVSSASARSAHSGRSGVSSASTNKPLPLPPIPVPPVPTLPSVSRAAIGSPTGSVFSSSPVSILPPSMSIFMAPGAVPALPPKSPTQAAAAKSVHASSPTTPLATTSPTSPRGAMPNHAPMPSTSSTAHSSSSSSTPRPSTVTQASQTNSRSETPRSSSEKTEDEGNEGRERNEPGIRPKKSTSSFKTFMTTSSRTVMPGGGSLGYGHAHGHSTTSLVSTVGGSVVPNGSAGSTSAAATAPAPLVPPRNPNRPRSIINLRTSEETTRSSASASGSVSKKGGAGAVMGEAARQGAESPALSERSLSVPVRPPRPPRSVSSASNQWVTESETDGGTESDAVGGGDEADPASIAPKVPPKTASPTKKAHSKRTSILGLIPSMDAARASFLSTNTSHTSATGNTNRTVSSSTTSNVSEGSAELVNVTGLVRHKSERVRTRRVLSVLGSAETSETTASQGLPTGLNGRSNSLSMKPSTARGTGMSTGVGVSGWDGVGAWSSSRERTQSQSTILGIGPQSKKVTPASPKAKTFSSQGIRQLLGARTGMSPTSPRTNDTGGTTPSPTTPLTAMSPGMKGATSASPTANSSPGSPLTSPSWQGHTSFAQARSVPPLASYAPASSSMTSSTTGLVQRVPRKPRAPRRQLTVDTEVTKLVRPTSSSSRPSLAGAGSIEERRNSAHSIPSARSPASANSRGATSPLNPNGDICAKSTRSSSPESVQELFVEMHIPEISVTRPRTKERERERASAIQAQEQARAHAHKMSLLGAPLSAGASSGEFVSQLSTGSVSPSMSNLGLAPPGIAHTRSYSEQFPPSGNLNGNGHARDSTITSISSISNHYPYLASPTEQNTFGGDSANGAPERHSTSSSSTGASGASYGYGSGGAAAGLGAIGASTYYANAAYGAGGGGGYLSPGAYPPYGAGGYEGESGDGEDSMNWPVTPLDVLGHIVAMMPRPPPRSPLRKSSPLLRGS